MSDGIWRQNERAFLQGQITLEAYLLSLQRYRSEHPLAPASVLTPRFMQVAYGLYELGGRTIAIDSGSMEFHKDLSIGPEPIVSIEYDGFLTREPQVQSGVLLDWPDYFIISESWEQGERDFEPAIFDAHCESYECALLLRREDPIHVNTITCFSDGVSEIRSRVYRIRDIAGLERALGCDSEPPAPKNEPATLLSRIRSYFGRVA